MRQTLHILLTVLCCASICVAAPKGQTFSRQSLTYVLHEDHQASLYQCHDRSESVVVPDTLVADGEQYLVVGIESHAFAGCSHLEQITLPESIQHIGEDAFNDTYYYRNKENWDNDGCLWIGNALIAVKSSSLKATYEIAPGTQLIAAGALGDNNKVKHLILPDGLKRIPDRAFSSCRKLRKIEIPLSVERIGRHSFSNTALYASDVNWTNGILYADSCAVDSRKVPQDLALRPATRILADGLLQGNRTLKSIDISESHSLQRIPEEAFADCRNLQTAILPENLQHIGARAFMGCHNLSGGNLFPTQLSSLGAGAFYECASISSVDLPEGILMIPAACFYRCESLREIRFNSLCRYFGMGAFMGCTSLTEVRFPATLQGMDTGAFSGCTNLILVDMSQCELEAVPSYAFSGCTQLQNVILPSSCQRLGREAFSYCPALSKLHFNTTLSIHPEAFIATPVEIPEE